MLEGNPVTLQGGSVRERMRVPSAGLALAVLAWMGPLAGPARGAIATDALVSVDSSVGAASITTGTFSTSAPNELLLAFVATDAGVAGMTVTSVTGGGLTWVLVRRTNAQLGTAEIWRAFAPATLANVTVTANLSQSVAASITVASFTGVDATGANGAGAIGATGTGNGNPGAPTATLVTTRDNSWVWGVGDDWDGATTRTLGPGQTLVHEYLATVNDTYWTQRLTSPTPLSGTSVTLNDTAPANHRFNLSTAEILPPAPTPTISGTVFEDVNYGGGAGRDSAAASGVGRPGARVELYDAAGVFVSATTTQAAGAYAFPGLAAGSYTVRVVNDSVSSSRTGYTTSLKAVQTFRTDASGGSAIAVTDHVGGQNPSQADAGAGSAGATLNTTTGVFSAGPSGTAQSITNVTLGASNVAGVGFGYCFDVIVNRNNSGQGSLRQFIANANALSNTGLAQGGRPAGRDNAIFMLADGTARPGLNTSYATMFAGGVATIALSSAYAAVSSPAVIDAQTQPGWSSAPIVELNGAGVAGGANGLNLTGGSITVRGLVIRRFGGYGVSIATTGGDTLSGCHVGTNAAGTAASANASGGVLVSNVNNVAAIVIGGTSAGAGNVISGNSGRGIDANSVNTMWIQGNRVGVNAAANAKLGNGGENIVLDACTSVTVGGTAAGAANIIGGNVGAIEGIWIINGTTGTIVQGNFIGTDPTGTLNLGNGYSGIGLGNSGSSGAVSDNMIGGTAAGAGNVIAFNGGPGVAVDLSASGTAFNNAILGNSIYSNTGLGIDLDDVYASPASPGVTPNDACDGDAGGNHRQNFPVLASVAVSGVNTTITGALNSTANTTFRVEFFSSPAADPSGFGQGRTYLGFVNVTTDGACNAAINTTLSSVAVVVGAVVTATATDPSNNTSEFGPAVVAGTATISGTVFEDANYGGGAGRDSATAAGVGRPGARVELYNSSGAFVTSTTSQAAGAYVFPGLLAGNYTVRVVNDSVSSARTGYTTGLKAVQTWRTNASTGAAVAVTDYVGGQNPSVADAGAGNAGATLNPATGVFSAGPSGTAQSITNVTLGANNVTGVGFGYSFDVIVNTNDAGQGSLRQWLTNANTLGGDASMAQPGLVAAKENAVFMISNGTAAPGLRASNNSFGGGVATISPASALPALSTVVVLDAQKQPSWTSAPVIELNGAGAGASVSGLTVTAGGSTVRGFVINRFTANGIVLSTSGGNTIAGNYIGSNSAGTAASANAGDGILVNGSANNIIGGTTASARNVVSGNTRHGLELSGAGATGNTLQGNHVGINAAGAAAIANVLDGINLNSGASGNTIGGTAAGAANVIAGNATGGGIAVGNLNLTDAGTSGNVIQGNYIGTDRTGTATIAGPKWGIYIDTNAANNTIGGTIAGAGNVITGGGWGGIGVISSGATGNAIEGNSIYANTGLGIDLLDNGVTANDGVKTAGQPNLRMDFPVFTSAYLNGTTLSVAGYVGSAPGQATFAGARVELFKSDNDPTGYGEGASFLGALTTDASGNFSGTLAVSGLAGGDRITGTATDASGNTSEFGADSTLRARTLVKRVFDASGNAIASGATLAKGTVVQFLLYVDNRGGAITDLRLSDALAAGFSYVAGSMRWADVTPSCAGTTCTGAEDAALLAAALSGAALTDAADGDTGGVSGATIQLGKANAGNAQLDIVAGKVYAIVFRARMQ